MSIKLHNPYAWGYGALSAWLEAAAARLEDTSNAGNVLFAAELRAALAKAEVIIKTGEVDE